MESFPIHLNTIWFILICLLFTGYAILDGFDLGVGIIYLFVCSENDRRTLINTIAPVWDGNEVWLLTGGGALFAAFPPVYATVFSSFYIALIFLLTALIARAVSVEFRNKVESSLWRSFWDWCFGLGSLISALLLGVAFGNILRGLPIDESGMYIGSFWDLLNPYSLVIGLLGISAFTMHGSLYLCMKTENELRERILRWALYGWIAFIVLYVIVSFLTIFYARYLFNNVLTLAGIFILIIFIASVVFVPILLNSKRYFRAFIASSFAIAGLFNLFAVGLYPRLVPQFVPGKPDFQQFTLTIYNASSSPKALSAMLVIALIGMPIVIGYTIFIYRVFRGKAKGEENGY
jgi:cytochrome d ubiquinol oxidase subunit II